MKFLRLAFYVLIAQLVLSGCAGEAVEETSSSSSSEINFDAYVNRNASSRSGVTDNTFLQGGTFNAGFGVFARYKHTDETISPLMLMNNEHVYWKNWKGDYSDWGYENTRYWPNEGSVDFYAFAPHSTEPKLVSPKDNGKNGKYAIEEPNSTYIYFPSNMSPVDLVWANAKGRTKTNERVKFTFSHALARIGFDITANNLTDGESITVQEVKLYCVSNNEHIGVFVMAGYLNLENGDWILDDNGTRWYYSWKPTGNDGEGPDVGKGPELKLDGDKLSNPNDIINNSPHSYIFIIPQEKREPFYLEITYTVERPGQSSQKVTVKKNLLDVLRKPGTNYCMFEEGKAYDFHLKLSPNPIHSRVTTNAKNWDVDVVNNVPCNQIGR